jgi:hypothetical protein
MKKLFEEILKIRSMTAIEYRIDDELPNVPDGPEKEALKKMQNTNKLDEIYALAHEQLGNHEEAAKLRQWMTDQELKKKESTTY